MIKASCLIFMILSLVYQQGSASMLKDDHIIAGTEDQITSVSPYDDQDYIKEINTFYANLQTNTKHDKLLAAAQYFLGQPYLLEPVGEGVHGKYSQEPLFRTDKFDCVSYVDTVLALANANDVKQFKQNFLRIRYAGKTPRYIYRTDWFTDLEWLPNAHQLGWLKDVTGTVVDEKGHAIARNAETTIDKPNWYRVKPYKVMHLLPPLPDAKQAEKLLDSLRSHAHLFSAQKSTLLYLPLDRLFKNGAPDEFIFEQIPSGSVIAIVRPDWPIRDDLPGFPQGYGTNLNVSHLGIALRVNSKLMFFNASSINGKVMMVTLSDYLQKYLDSPTVKGIHVEKII